ncbi:MAG: hypothetical protein ABIK09_01035 [Pseudomonadota bacterium]
MKTTILGLILALSLFGCDSGGGSSGGGVDTTGGGEDTPVPAASCADLVDLTGRSFAITKLNATYPTGNLDPVWAKDISTYELVLVFNVVEHDRDGGTLTLTMTSALAEMDGETPVAYTYALVPAQFQTALEDDPNGCKFVIAADNKIELDIITPTVSKPFHIEGITGSGVIGDDGTTISDGFLQGGIRETEAEDLCLEVVGLGTVNFHWFMNMAHLCADYDLDGDGTNDAYFFEGYLDAELTTLFQPGITPIESLVETCEPDTDECL